MKNTDLLTLVKEDVVLFLNENDEFFFNERDFQMHLAAFLRSSMHYDDVDVEYAVPREGKIEISKKDYPWDTEIRIDIVLMKDGEYLPIELKYKTKKAELLLSRFGENVGSAFVKDQSAKDLGCYAFWKDVYRLELIARKYKNVKHGLSVFLTNDESYMKAPKDSHVRYYNYSLHAGKHTTNMHWTPNDSGVKDDLSGFDLQKEYTNEWAEVMYQSVKCYFTMVTV